jgi:hypothetical protein
MKKAAYVYADGKSRSDVENLSSEIWRAYKPKYEEGGMGPGSLASPGLEGTMLGARLLWMAHVIGHICMGLVPKPGAEQTKNVEMAKARPQRRADSAQPVPFSGWDLLRPALSEPKTTKGAPTPKSGFGARLAAARKQQEQTGGRLKFQPSFQDAGDDRDEPIVDTPAGVKGVRMVFKLG